MKLYHQHIWVRSRMCGCLVTWFCYQLIAKPGNKTAAPSWPDLYTDSFIMYACLYVYITCIYFFSISIPTSPNNDSWHHNDTDDTSFFLIRRLMGPWVQVPSIHSFSSGKWVCNIKGVITKHMFKFLSTSCEIALRWMPQNTFDHESTLVQLIKMAWRHQAISHKLSQCWPSSMLPYTITWPQWAPFTNMV